jgi:Tol biopolymer transport system component
LIEMLDRNGCERHSNVDQTAFFTDMTWSPDGRALAFHLAAGQLEVSDARPSCGLFVVSSDGQTLERLLPAPEWEAPLSYSPAWAPDGSRIAVALAQTIALVPLDGSELVDLGRPCDGCQPEIWGSIGGWSPDGSLIAAQFVDDGCCADDTTHYVAVVDVATAEWTLLWSGTSRDQRNPQWAPGETGYQLVGWLHDGRVAAQSREGVFATHPDEPGEWVQLPFHGARDPILTPDGLGELGLWSPDQTRDALDADNPTDGLRVRHLTTGRIDKIADWILAYPLAWSPDGEQLAVVRGSARELYLIDADGANPRKLGSAMGNAGAFLAAWQPVWPEGERQP